MRGGTVLDAVRAHGATVLGALVTDRHKLVMDMHARRFALYDLQSDPREQRDLSATDPWRVRRLARRLRAPGGGSPLAAGPRPVADDTARKLRALGYTQ